MGRGRQRAKNAKIARELKYFSPETNYQALEQELASSKSDVATDTRERLLDDDEDEWAGWSDSR